MNDSVLHRALALAVARHDGQDREGEAPLPYAIHPIDVAAKLRYVGNVKDEALLAAAFLHDTLEETATTIEEIRREFPPEVAQLVQEMTREEPSAERVAGMTKSEIWELRSNMLLTEIGEMSANCRILKLADRLSNLEEAFREKRGKKLSRYLVQSKKILEIVPRVTNSGLWDAINELLTRDRLTAVDK